MESGLRPAAAQLENRQRRFGLRLLGLPLGDQAREMVGVPTAVGRRLTNALRYSGRMESTVLLRNQSTRRGTAAGRGGGSLEAEKTRSGLTKSTEGSRLDGGAAGCLVCKNGQPWVGIKAHVCYNQEATTLSAPPSPGRWRPLREDRRHRNKSRSSPTHRPPSDGWPRRSRALARCTRFGQGSASQCYRGPGRTSPSRSGGAQHTRGSQETSKWAKLATEEPDARGVEWLGYSDWAEARAMPLPRSFAHLKRRFRRRSGQKRSSGREARPPGTSTKCRAGRSWMSGLQVAPRGSPRS